MKWTGVVMTDWRLYRTEEMLNQLRKLSSHPTIQSIASELDLRFWRMHDELIEYQAKVTRLEQENQELRETQWEAPH